MSRYIDAEPFNGMRIVKPINVEMDLDKYCIPGHFNVTEHVRVAEVDDVPTADVQEVRRGKWLVFEQFEVKKDKLSRLDCKNIITRYYCSICYCKTIYNTNFCPDCGARMDGD